MNRIRIAWFSQFDSPDLGGSGSKSEYLSRLVVPLLKQRFGVDCYGEHPCVVDNLQIGSYKSFYKHHHEKRYDLCFYQVEDSTGNAFVRDFARFTPGIMYCHDFYQTSCASSFPQNPKYKNRRVWCHPKSEDYYTNKEGRSANCYSLLLQGLIRIFSTQRNLQDFLDYSRFDAKQINEFKTFYIPFAVKKLDQTIAISDNREFCFCGGVESEYRAVKVFAALSAIKGIKIRWLVDGMQQGQALSMLNENNFNFVEVVSGKTPEKWQKMMGGSRGAIVVVFSAYRDLEPYTSISIGSGVPTIVSNYAHGGTIPKDVVYSVGVGYGEEKSLQSAVSNIITKRESENSTIAPQRYIEELHSPEVVFDQISITIENYAEYLKNSLDKWTRYNIHDPFTKYEAKVNNDGANQ